RPAARDRADLRHPRRRRRRAAARRQRGAVRHRRRFHRASPHRCRRARVQAGGDEQARRWHARGERQADRGGPQGRAGHPARCRPAQRGCGVARRGTCRPDGGGDRARGADHRCRARVRASRGPARRATGGRSRGSDRMTVATPRNVVADIAERRRADIRAEVAATDPAVLVDAALAATRPRPIAERLAAPGLHLIAEIKRASPSAGRIAGDGEDIVARARAYEAGGASAISVLCEPHWFGGSVDDLRAVRAAVAVPVLAKDFVVEDIQLPMLRAAGADMVLLLAVLHDADRLAALVERALEVGLEPLVEVHDESELDAALTSGARLIGLNNRDLRTLEVDVERASRLRASVPDDRLVIAESGVRDAATVARWRALVGEALVRAADPAAAARAFVHAGAAPDDPANVARRPLVKICGVTDLQGALAAVAAGADAIGLNVVPGTPRELGLEEAADLARIIRAAAIGDHRPEIIAITADAT